MRATLKASIVCASVLMPLAIWQAPLSATESIVQEADGFTGIWEIARREERGRGNRGEGRGRGERQDGRRGPPPERSGPSGSDQSSGPDVEGLDRGDLRIYSLMTPAGRAVFDDMNPRDLPANNCLSNGLPSLVGIPDVQEWSFEGDVLTIHYANFNAVRTIYLDGRAATGEPTHFGHSTGERSGNTFVVTTSNLTATLGGLARNAPGSASRTYVERYELSDNGNEITGMLTIRDPEYLTQELRRPIAFSRAADGIYVPEIGCSVEASQRYLD